MKWPWLGVLAMAVTLRAQPASTNAPAAVPVPGPEAETPAARDQRMAWFREARFGLFVHWGVYAVAAGEFDGEPVPGAGEWIQHGGRIPFSKYRGLQGRFNPVKFDAAAWVRAAKEAGMKYLVITSKHHDGFCLWPATQTNWSVGGTPFGRDPLRELADECARQGVRFCLYHSIMDWQHPNYAGTSYNDVEPREPDMDRYTAHLKGQLKELVERYQPGVLWFDGEWESCWTHERGTDLYAFLRGLDPRLILNNRVGKGRAGMEGMDQGDQRVGDFGTPEQQIPATGFGPGVDWESCMTMNDTWGFKSADTNWKSATTLVRNLIDCASKGGNYLLNVGPTAEGLIPQASLDRLAEVGRWMAVNGESIHGTGPGPFRRVSYGRCTSRPGRLYLHVFDAPKNGKLSLPGLQNRATVAFLLADPARTPLPLSSDDVSLRVTLPDDFRAKADPHATVVVVDYQGKLDVEDTLPVQGRDGGVALGPDDAVLRGGVRVEEADGVANIGAWTDAKATVAWDFRVTNGGRFEVVLDQACPGPAAGGTFTLTAEGQTIGGTTAATAGWQAYTNVTVGAVLLTPGLRSVLITPQIKPGDGLMNVRSVTLRPVAVPPPAPAPAPGP